MKKLIKFILKLIGFLLILILVAIGVVIWLAADSTAASFDATKEYASFDEVLGRGFYDSIEDIKLLSESELSDKEKNHVTVDVTVDELNNYIVTMVQSNVNENYMKTEDYIMTQSGVTLESIFFEELDGKLAAKARISAFGFYHTSVLLSGDLQFDSDTDMLKISFENFKLGKKIKINRSLVISLLQKFNIKMNTGTNFDLDTLTLSFDISTMMNNLIAGSKFEDFFNNCDYDFTYADGQLSMVMDTTKVFVPTADLPDLTTPLVMPAYDNVDYINQTAKLTFTEENFNKMILKSFQDSETSYGTECEVGSYAFKFELREMYYDIANNQVIGNVYLNDMGTSCTITVSVSNTKDSDGYINAVLFNVQTITLGNLPLTSIDNFFETITVDADTLTSNGTYKVSGLTFDKENKQCVMDIKF